MLWAPEGLAEFAGHNTEARASSFNAARDHSADACKHR
jgi:hypothetical protein